MTVRLPWLFYRNKITEDSPKKNRQDLFAPYIPPTRSYSRENNICTEGGSKIAYTFSLDLRAFLVLTPD